MDFNEKSKYFITPMDMHFKDGLPIQSLKIFAEAQVEKG